MVGKKLLSFLFFLFFAHACGASQSLELSVTTPTGEPVTHVSQGEPFLIKITSHGDRQPDHEPIIQNSSALALYQPCPVCTTLTIINGVQNRMYTYTHTARYDSVGRFALGPAHYQTANTRVESNPLVITVTPCTTKQEKPTKDPFMYVTLSPKTAYIGQQVLITVCVCYKKPITRCQLEQPSLHNAHVYSLGEPTQQRVTIDSSSYPALVYQFACYAKEGSELVIPKLTAIVEREQEQDQGIFAHFRSFFTRTDDRIPINSQPLAIPLKELPKITQILNGVGEFDNFSLTADSTRIDQSQGITLSMALAGIADVDHAQLPELKLPPTVRVYQANTTVSPDPKNNKRWIRCTRWVLQALEPQTFVIAPHAFTFFDPRTERVRTLQTTPLTIKIIPSTQKSVCEGSAQNFSHKKSPSWPPLSNTVFVVLILVPLFFMLSTALGRPYAPILKYKARVWHTTQQLTLAAKKQDSRAVYDLWFVWFARVTQHPTAHESLETIGEKFLAKDTDKKEWCAYAHALKKAAFDTHKKNLGSALAQRTRNWIKIFRGQAHAQ